MSGAQGSWRVVIGDDHALIRQGFRLMTEAIPGVEVVGEGADGVEVLEITRRLKPSLVMIDVEMPRLDGISAIRTLAEEFPELPVVVLTVHEEETVIRGAVEAGASGFMPKSASLAEMVEMFRVLGRERFYISPSLAGSLVGMAYSKSKNGHRLGPRGSMITDREQEILELLAEGLSARRIALKLSVRERTVTTHIDHIYRKLGVNNRVEAIRQGVQAGLVRLPTY
ncbi:MAG: response regulator transcription factor [Acidimicrobiales bacterium]|nr:response regulator transcription factor [Acidimicrobiales bacterium]